jgi:hypothetical protein
MEKSASRLSAFVRECRATRNATTRGGQERAQAEENVGEGESRTWPRGSAISRRWKRRASWLMPALTIPPGSPSAVVECAEAGSTATLGGEQSAAGATTRPDAKLTMSAPGRLRLQGCANACGGLGYPNRSSRHKHPASDSVGASPPARCWMEPGRNHACRAPAGPCASF